MPDAENYLFTYGTLMRGFDNPFATKLRTSSEYIGSGSFPGTLYRVSWYPGAVYDPHNPNSVYGEVYQVHDPGALFAELDEYEDITEHESESLYLRRQVSVTLESGEIIHCWAYLYNQPVEHLECIKSGKFSDV